jgi:hypothetical protein
MKPRGDASRQARGLGITQRRFEETTMDKLPSTAGKGEPWPVLLMPEETKQVAGGINPQPLPPGEDRPSAKLE